MCFGEDISGLVTPWDIPRSRAFFNNFLLRVTRVIYTYNRRRYARHQLMTQEQKMRKEGEQTQQQLHRRSRRQQEQTRRRLLLPHGGRKRRKDSVLHEIQRYNGLFS